MKLPLFALALCISVSPALAQQRKVPVLKESGVRQMSPKESEISKTLITQMRPNQRRIFNQAIRNMLGTGNSNEKQVLARAEKRMRLPDQRIWSAYVKSLKPDQLSVLKKMLLNATSMRM